MVDGALVLGRIQDFNSRALDLLIFVVDKLHDGVDHFRSADLRERVACA